MNPLLVNGPKAPKARSPRVNWCLLRNKFIKLIQPFALQKIKKNEKIKPAKKKRSTKEVDIE